MLMMGCGYVACVAKCGKKAIFRCEGLRIAENCRAVIEEKNVGRMDTGAFPIVGYHENGRTMFISIIIEQVMELASGTHV